MGPSMFFVVEFVLAQELVIGVFDRQKLFLRSAGTQRTRVMAQ